MERASRRNVDSSTRARAKAASRLILASSSPRRAEILRRAGIPYRVRAADVDERLLPDETPRAHVLRLAQLKAERVRRPGEWVLGADTVVVIGKRVLGKPRDARDAA